MTGSEQHEVVIIGGGPAGYTAALYSARAGLSPVCVEGWDSGGQISRTSRIENFPGQPGISGSELSTAIREQAVSFGAQMIMGDVTGVDLGGRPFTVEVDDRKISAQAVIIATGSRPRRLDVPGEDEWEGRGVAYCAICDGAFFAGKEVVIVGGGDAAVEEVLSLGKIASKVTLVHRRNELRASVHSQQALAVSGVEPLTPYVVEELVGSDDVGLTGLKLRHLEDGTTRYLPADGVFIAVGQEPASALFSAWLDTDERGFIKTTGVTTATRVPGVFAAGDVADPRYRQAVTAAATGCAAAIDVERWLLGARTAAGMRAAGEALVTR